MKIVSIEKIDVDTDEKFGPLRLYVCIQKETILENLQNRHYRPYTLYKKFVIPELIKQCPELVDAKFSWSQKCGCSCGCSPGFIIRNKSYILDKDRYRRCNYFVTVEGN